METCIKDGEEKHHCFNAYLLLPALQLWQSNILQFASLNGWQMGLGFCAILCLEKFTHTNKKKINVPWAQLQQGSWLPSVHIKLTSQSSLPALPPTHFSDLEWDVLSVEVPPGAPADGNPSYLSETAINLGKPVSITCFEFFRWNITEVQVLLKHTGRSCG